MTTPTDEEMKKMERKYFKDKLQSFAEYRTVFKHKYEGTKEERPRSLTTFRTYTAFAYVMTNELCNVYELFQNTYEALIELDNDIRDRTAKLDTIIQEIRNQGVDLSKVKTEMESFKASVNPIAIATVSQFAQDLNRKMDEYKKKMKENDLAE